MPYSGRRVLDTQMAKPITFHEIANTLNTGSPSALQFWGGMKRSRLSSDWDPGFEPFIFLRVRKQLTEKAWFWWAAKDVSIYHCHWPVMGCVMSCRILHDVAHGNKCSAISIQCTQYLVFGRQSTCWTFIDIMTDKHWIFAPRGSKR